MGVNSLKELLLNAKNGSYAVGAFNIFNYSSAKAAVMAAEELNSPIILQTSVSTVKAIGTIELIRMLSFLKKDATVPVVIHLDHCTDINIAKECIDAGWDSIMIDASAKPIKENINITLEVKHYAEKQNVCVEGELGVIQGVEDDISASTEELASYEESVEYINSTGIDTFAPAIGTAHGVYKTKAVLNFDLVKRLSETSECPVVIHGGTGLSEDEFHHLIKNGGAKVNISTAIKCAYFDGYNEYMKLNSGELNPFKDLEGAQLCDILRNEYKFKIGKTVETLESTMATLEDAKMLLVKKLFPLLQLDSIVYAQGELPIEFSKVLFRGDKIKLHLEFNNNNSNV